MIYVYDIYIPVWQKLEDRNAASQVVSSKDYTASGQSLPPSKKRGACGAVELWPPKLEETDGTLIYNNCNIYIYIYIWYLMFIICI